MSSLMDFLLIDGFTLLMTPIGDIGSMAGVAWPPPTPQQSSTARPSVSDTDGMTGPSPRLQGHPLPADVALAPPLMTSCWNCLCHDVLKFWPDALAKALQNKDELKLDGLLRQHGEGWPPCPWYLFQKAFPLKQRGRRL